jgi:hypothetical protein
MTILTLTWLDKRTREPIIVLVAYSVCQLWVRMASYWVSLNSLTNGSLVIFPNMIRLTGLRTRLLQSEF